MVDLIEDSSAFSHPEELVDLNFEVVVRPAYIYLLDEPSASLDSEQHIVASKVIKRFILHAKKTAFVVEHDFIMATCLADNVIVYKGQHFVDCTANAPHTLLFGMNKFLSLQLQWIQIAGKKRTRKA